MTDEEQQTHALRAAWGGHHDTTRILLNQQGLTIAGLEQLRRDLRPGGRWAPTVIPAEYASQAAMLRNDITQLLAQHHGPGFEDYYRVAGDLLPAVPDDVSTLEPPDRPGGRVKLP